MLKVLRAGLFTTVQDEGRHGFRHLGISQGGALDLPALKVANLLVGNNASAAGLEITLGQFAVEFFYDGYFALTGADCHAELDGQPVWCGWRWPVSRGQVLRLMAPLNGMRTYLAVSGGLMVPEMLGSRSTDFQAGYGGFEGRALKDGDQLPTGPSTLQLGERIGVELLSFGSRIRALPGPEYAEFAPEEQERFWRSPWQLSPQSNRMGYRLQGPALTRMTNREMRSHGLLSGVVQVPHNGQPVILLADAQTTGGYPRMACVIEADLWKLAQARLGSFLHFVQCSHEEAHAASRALQSYLQQVERELNGHRS